MLEDKANTSPLTLSEDIPIDRILKDKTSIQSNRKPLKNQVFSKP